MYIFRKSLQYFRGRDYDVTQELKEITDKYEENQRMARK